MRYLGKTLPTFDGKDIIINDVKYIERPVLYELMFMAKPKDDIASPNRRALKGYKNIVEHTNLYRLNYEADGKKE